MEMNMVIIILLLLLCLLFQKPHICEKKELFQTGLTFFKGSMQTFNLKKQMRLNFQKM